MSNTTTSTILTAAQNVLNELQSNPLSGNSGIYNAYSYCYVKTGTDTIALENTGQTTYPDGTKLDESTDFPLPPSPGTWNELVSGLAPYVGTTAGGKTYAITDC